MAKKQQNEGTTEPQEPPHALEMKEIQKFAADINIFSILAAGSPMEHDNRYLCQVPTQLENFDTIIARISRIHLWIQGDIDRFFYNAMGRVLTQVEAIGLPERQEKAVKDNIKNDIRLALKNCAKQCAMDFKRFAVDSPNAFPDFPPEGWMDKNSLFIP